MANLSSKVKIQFGFRTFYKYKLTSYSAEVTSVIKGSGCGAVGRAVAYDTRGPGFESSHRQLLFEHLFTVNCL